LVDVDDLVHIFDPINAVIISGLGMGTLEPGGEGFIENLNHQSGLARTRDTGDADKLTQRDLNFKVFEIIFAGSNDGKRPTIACTALARDIDLQATRQIRASERIRILEDVFHGTFGDNLPTMFSSTGTEIKDPIR
jgi:hypothetical protein